MEIFGKTIFILSCLGHLAMVIILQLNCYGYEASKWDYKECSKVSFVSGFPNVFNKGRESFKKGGVACFVQ